MCIRDSCHMDWHLAAGMAMVVVQAPEEAQKVLDVPPYVKEQCKVFWNEDDEDATGP